MIKDKIKRLFPFVSDFAKKGRAIKRELEYTFYSLLPESMYPKVLGIMYKQYQGTTLNWGGGGRCIRKKCREQNYMIEIQ